MSFIGIFKPTWAVFCHVEHLVKFNLIYAKQCIFSACNFFCHRSVPGAPCLVQDSVWARCSFSDIFRAILLACPGLETRQRAIRLVQRVALETLFPLPTSFATVSGSGYSPGVRELDSTAYYRRRRRKELPQEGAWVLKLPVPHRSMVQTRGRFLPKTSALIRRHNAANTCDQSSKRIAGIAWDVESSYGPTMYFFSLDACA